MREIKFRVWDKKENEMFYSNMYQNKTSMIYGLGNFLKECSDIEEPIMQYTGFKDKNGVEIYEGDLLQSFYDDGEIHEVIWHEESASFRVATYLDNRHGGSFAELFFMDDIHENCNKIIGNIYENTELLE